MRTTASALSFTLLSLCAAAATAADSAPATGPTISGFADTTFNYNLNRPQNDANNGHSFDNQANTFDLNLAQLLIQGNPRGDRDVGYTFRLDYGTAARAIRGSTSPGDDVEVEEAYGTYRCPGSGFGVKIGKFVTYEGIEVIESISDPTITRGLLFGLAEPYTHTGALVTYQANDQLDAAFGLVNGWDLVTDNNRSKTIVGKVGFNPDAKLGVTGSFLLGPEKANNTADNRFSLDVTAISRHVEKLDLNLQVNYGQEEKAAIGGGLAKWFGLGVQPVYHIDKKFSVGGRLEFFDDQDGARTGIDGEKVISFSVAPGYQVTDHFLTRAELRLDHSNKNAFGGPDGATQKKNQAELAAEAIFSF